MWARALTAVGAAAVLLTGVDLVLGAGDPARGLAGHDPLGATSSVLGVMSAVALAGLVPLGLAVRGLVRRWPRRRAAALAAALVLVILLAVDRELLLARPAMVGGALVGFALALAATWTRMARPRWRAALALASLVAAVALGVINGRTFVGVDLEQHLALAIGAWALAVPATWVLSRRIEQERGSRGPRAGLLVLVGSLALALLTIRGSSAAADSRAARYFVRRLAPQSAALLRGGEPALDLDRDGYATGFGGGDCDGLDGEVHPGATELPGDGVDQNCVAGDPTLAEVDELRAALTHAGSPAQLPARRLLLITVDALRDDHPLIAAHERLAGRCRELAVAYAAAPSTTYAVHALMTGRYPSQGVYQRLGRWNVPIADPAARVAAVLRDAGFATGAAVFHHRFDPRMGLVDGFDDTWIAAARPEVIDGDAAPATIERALAWIRTHASPSLSWVHLYDPHEPYLPRDGAVGVRARYAAEVRDTDARLVELLDAWPELDATAIVLVGDHGEAFGEHGEHGHGASLFDEQVRVPLWVCPPRGQPLPADRGPASGVDVAPTLLALAGVARPEGMGGRSLIDAPPAPVFAETAGEEEPMIMVVRWPYKLLHLPRARLWLLFDLERDPAEQIDLAESEPETLRELQRLLDRWLAWRGPESPTLRAPAPAAGAKPVERRP